VASLAGGFRLRQLRKCWWLAAERRTHQVRRMQPPHVGDLRDDLREDADPTTVWFTATWLFATARTGFRRRACSGPRVRLLPDGVGDVPPVALRARPSGPGAPVRPGRGGRDVHRRGGAGSARWSPARQEVTLVVVAVEVHEPNGFGRCQMRIIQDASAESLHPFVLEHIEPGDGGDHRRLAGLGRDREARVLPGAAQPARRPPGGR